jgi:hypothetical protein
VVPSCRLCCPLVTVPPAAYIMWACGRPCSCAMQGGVPKALGATRPLPRLDCGRRLTVIVPSSAALPSFIGTLLARARAGTELATTRGRGRLGYYLAASPCPGEAGRRDHEGPRAGGPRIRAVPTAARIRPGPLLRKSIRGPPSPFRASDSVHAETGGRSCWHCPWPSRHRARPAGQ